MSRLIVIGGPTASGKTSLSIALAQHFEVPILSADSRQFYHELNIGVARPTEAELVAAKHYFIADRSLARPLHAGGYEQEALQLLEHLFQQYEQVILVGGSGLFIQAVCEGFDTFPTVIPEVLTKVAELEATAGLAGLQIALQAADPAYFEEVDRLNPARLRRALEVSWSAGQAYSSFLEQSKPKRPFDCMYLQADWPREVLYERINQRVDMMVEAGLEDEVRSVEGFKESRALQTVGYQEWFPYFRGECDRATVIELIKRNSRRYAKRQLTWFRRASHWQLVAKGELAVALKILKGDGTVSS